MTLIEIEKLMQENRRLLDKIVAMPYLKNYVKYKLGKKFIYDEQHYDKLILHYDFQNWSKNGRNRFSFGSFCSDDEE